VHSSKSGYTNRNMKHEFRISRTIDLDREKVISNYEYIQLENSKTQEFIHTQFLSMWTGLRLS